MLANKMMQRFGSSGVTFERVGISGSAGLNTNNIPWPTGTQVGDLAVITLGSASSITLPAADNGAGWVSFYTGTSNTRYYGYNIVSSDNLSQDINPNTSNVQSIGRVEVFRPNGSFNVISVDTGTGTTPFTFTPTTENAVVGSADFVFGATSGSLPRPPKTSLDPVNEYEGVGTSIVFGTGVIINMRVFYFGFITQGSGWVNSGDTIDVDVAPNDSNDQTLSSVNGVWWSLNVE